MEHASGIRAQVLVHETNLPMFGPFRVKAPITGLSPAYHHRAAQAAAFLEVFRFFEVLEIHAQS